MARRRIGQEDLIARPEPRAASSLSELAALLDWSEIDRHLVGISGAAKGELGWPPLALFRGLLLATWHDLSDVRLAEALDDRASFRRFCGFAAHEPTPERTAFVRFRRELVRRGLDRALFEATTRQLEAIDLAWAEEEASTTGKPARRFRDFRWSTLDSWSRRRRVIGSRVGRQRAHVTLRLRPAPGMALPAIVPTFRRRRRPRSSGSSLQGRG
jgi:hypothetical protein